MTVQTKAILKSYFNTGDIPTEANFTALVDTIGQVTLTVAASNASDGSKGRADYVCDGTNDEVEIQAAIDALPVSGGIVHLTEGLFTCSKVGTHGTTPNAGYCILIDAADVPLILEGAGWATTIKLANNQDANTILLYVRGESGAERNNPTVIRDLKIDGNKTNQINAWTDYADLEFAYANDIIVQGCYLTDGNWASARVYLSSERAYFLNNYFALSAKNGLRTENRFTVISGNYFKTSGVGTCLGLATNSDLDIPSEFISIQNNVFESSATGTTDVAMTGARHVQFFGNTFLNHTNSSGYALQIGHYDAATNYSGFENVVFANTFYNVRNGIQLTSGASADLSNYRNLIANNLIIEGTGVNLANGILESGANVDNNIILDNIIQGATTPLTKVGTSTRVEGNMGYVTENKGAAASVSDGGTIAHGCATTPTVVLVSASVAGEMATVTSIDATNITMAIKKHDNSAGTAQTVYWRAYV